MTSLRRQHSLRLVTQRESTDGSTALPQPKEQLPLFPAKNLEAVLTLLRVDLVDEATFVSSIRALRPRLVIDTRTAPRFDVGHLNRRAAFSLFKEEGATYLDLAGSSGSADASGYLRELVVVLRAFSKSKDRVLGPIVFLDDGALDGDTVCGAVSSALDAPAAPGWTYVPLAELSQAP